MVGRGSEAGAAQPRPRAVLHPATIGVGMSAAPCDDRCGNAVVRALMVLPVGLLHCYIEIMQTFPSSTDGGDGDIGEGTKIVQTERE